jgi:hypothetical protein
VSLASKLNSDKITNKETNNSKVLSTWELSLSYTRNSTHPYLQPHPTAHQQSLSPTRWIHSILYTPHTFKNLCNITHPRAPTSTKWCSPFRFPDCEQTVQHWLHCAYLSRYYRQTDQTLRTCNGSNILIQSSYIPTGFGGGHHHHHQGSPTPLTRTPLL